MYLSGAAFSAGVLGLPDVGLFTLTELAQQTTYLTRAVRLPLIVDADTGFGEALNVERTVVELEAAGAAAIQLEDQQLPKRCGHLSGKSLVEPDAMCAKLRAAAGAASDPGPGDHRPHRCPRRRRVSTTPSSGPSAISTPAPIGFFPKRSRSTEEFERFADAIEAPLVANMTEFGKSPLLTLDELADLGYSVVLYPVTLLRVAMKAVRSRRSTCSPPTARSANMLDLMQTREELYDLLDYQDFEERDRAHFGRCRQSSLRPVLSDSARW